MSRASTLVLLCTFAFAACGGSGSEEGVEEGPAPPCSINGMLFRDTPDTEFVQCGTATGVLVGEVAACVKRAAADEKAFVVQWGGPGLTPAHRRPALVGARFDEGYALRIYLSDTEDVGRRSGAKVVATSPGSVDLRITKDRGGERRCVMASVRPQVPDETWVVLDAKRDWSFHAAECLEWFGAKTWLQSPLDAKFEADKQPRCLPDT